MSDTVSAATERRGALRLWALAFAGFFLLIAAWSVATPYDGAPDEQEHVIRAAGVAAGQFAPKPEVAKKGSGAFQTVPRGLVRDQCWQFNVQANAGCAPSPGGDSTPVRVGTAAGRYHPAYYAAVGWPLVLRPGMSGVLGARLISGAFCAALLAGAFVVIMRRSRRRLMMAALLAVTTPMTVHLASSVNPSGLELAAAIAFFAAFIPLMLGERTGSWRGLIFLAGISGLLLSMLRQTGPLLLATAFVAFAFPLRRGNLPALIRQRAAVWWAAGIAVSTAVAAAWIVVMKASDLGNYKFPMQLSPFQASWLVAERWGNFLEQMVGVASYLDARLPTPFYTTWQAAVFGLLFLGVVFGRLLDRWRLLVLLVGGALVPTAMQVRYFNETGYVMQGRYMMPILAGAVLFAAYVAEDRGLDLARCRAATRLFVVLFSLHLVFLSYTMVRWQHGLRDFTPFRRFNPLAGEWHPVLGSLLPLVMAAAGIAVIGWLGWRAQRGLPGGPAAEADQASETGARPIAPAAGAFGPAS
ncbi:DUF2142 domain-containing protein [Planosporangium flavigriseum]|uniref:DUF2142 domain-containing protein n=1 Tax=Planosporangium flavigriseum TaxID=373681 RepID=A0A8J3LQ12_9ACTN|nr:DUF2142 domain-containing protein [Planosporangium flavigriseum]NJC65588.1 DUF2142 domain-containing protein [Planosporangium flavigriseum]GIG74750.1 hypothetical protein Pfl04_31540 [Planosporangium flavigriseum]